MPSMFQRGGKDKSTGGSGRSGSHSLRIMHLDKATIEYRFDKSTLGNDCLLFAAEEFRIKEHIYFSLKFKSIRQKTRWVQKDKPIKKQLERYSLDGLYEPITLSLEVKFYPIQVHLVEDEVTRYLFYLQLKMDILDGRLDCSAQVAIKLAAYSVQCEFGDFDPDKHSTLKLRELNLLPEKYCKIGELDSMLTQISHLHQGFTGTSASIAEQSYLKITQSLPEYGYEGFEVLDDSGDKLSIGTCAMGIFVKNVGDPPLYMRWDELKRVRCEDKYFGVESRSETVLFNTADVDSAKYIMRCVSEQNMFFLKQSQQLFNGNHYTTLPNPRRCLSSYASEEILSSDARRRLSSSPAVPYPLQHAVSTTCFTTELSIPALSRYHSDADMNSRKQHFDQGPLPTPSSRYVSPSRRTDPVPSQLTESSHAITHHRRSNTLPSNVRDTEMPATTFKQSHKQFKPSPIPVLLGFRKKSFGELLTEPYSSLPVSSRSHAPSPLSPFHESDSAVMRHSPSPFMVIYEGEESTHHGVPISVRSKFMEPSDNSQIHSQLSKTNSVPGIDLNENTSLGVSKLYSTVIPRKYSKSEEDPGPLLSPTEETKEIAQFRIEKKDKFTASERFVPPIEPRISLAPRRSASLAQRSITDDPVKYYKFLASLFKRKHESWCADEFSNFKCEPLSTSHSRKPENINKNRFREILPYNSTRVQLDAANNTESSDYINASHVLFIIKDHDYHFIAAQSPMRHTCTNFWQMVWEQDVRIIAMLDSVDKDETHHSHVYFPASSDPTIDDYIQFDQYKISIRSFQDKGAFLFRQFTVKHIPSGKTKKVFHLQFLDWITQDSPKSYEGFQAYIDYTRGVFSKESTPLLIHCNSGTGPTGVFILLYLLQEHIRLQEILHVQNALVTIRRQRMEMVSTPGQFKFVYLSMYKYTQYLLAMEDRHTLI